MNTKQTSLEIASLAGKVLSNPKSGKIAKKLAGTALAQARQGRKRK